MLRRRSTGALLAAAFASCAVVLVLVVVRANDGAARPSAGEPAAVAGPGGGAQIDRPVPPMPLLDVHGRRTSLAAYRGKDVIIAPTMTLCHEVCPMTTGALMRVQRLLAADGLAKRVAILEITVDPWRDTPARLRAFMRLTHVDFQLLTGTKAEIRRLWKFFGIFYRRVPQDDPPDIDWWTHRPERFDVQHSDALLYLDTRGHERLAILGMPDTGGRLDPALRRLLNDEGRDNLKHPRTPWTVGEAMRDLRDVMAVGGGTA